MIIDKISSCICGGGASVGVALYPDLPPSGVWIAECLTCPQSAIGASRNEAISNWNDKMMTAKALRDLNSMIIDAHDSSLEGMA